jgi:hypothetical protein
LVTDSLSFRNRNNEKFSCDDDDDDEPLVKDNAPEPVAPFPDIPAETPGILLEDHITTDAVEPEADPIDASEETRIRLARANADLGPNIIFNDVEDDRSGIRIQNNAFQHNAYQQNNNNYVYNLQNNIVEANEAEEEPPELVYCDDSSDDEDYTPSDEEDVPLEVDEEEVLEDRSDEQP